jgi:hypothetical protein
VVQRQVFSEYFSLVAKVIVLIKINSSQPEVFVPVFTLCYSEADMCSLWPGM